MLLQKEVSKEEPRISSTNPELFDPQENVKLNVSWKVAICPQLKCHSLLPFYSGKPQIHCVGDIERRQDQSVLKVAKRKQMFFLAGQKILRVSREI